MFFKFNKPGGFSGGTCRWKVKSDTQSVVSMYSWKPNEARFVWRSANQGGTNPPIRTFWVGSGSNWWSTGNKLHLMAETTADSGGWGMSCDLCKITY